jgi:hypothetical protein
MRAQALFLAGDLKGALEVCGQFPASPDVRILSIRLAGSLNLTAFQNEQWAAQRLEAIQYLSLGHLWLGDAVRRGDFQTLFEMAPRVIGFCLHGETSSIGNIAAAFNNLSFLQIEGCARFVNNVRRHIVRYAITVIAFWLDVVVHGAQISSVRAERLITDEAIAGLVNIRDESVVPLYFDDPRLSDWFHPSIVELTRMFSGIVGVFAAIGLRTDLEAAIGEFAKLGMPGWAGFVDFVRGGELFVPEDADIYFVGSVVGAAGLLGRLEAVKGRLVESLAGVERRLQESIRVEDIPDGFGERVLAERARIALSIAMIAQRLN